MSDIPRDLFCKIFILLPAKSLIRSRAVCKAWQSIIDDPCFVKAHTDKQKSSNTILIRNSTGPPYFPLYSVDLETLNSTNGLQSISATPLNFTRPELSRLPKFPMPACNGLMLIAPAKPEQNWEIWNPFTHERLELPQLDLPTSHVAGCGIGYDYATDDYKAVVIFRDSSEQLVYRTHVYSLKLDSWKRIGNCQCGESGLSNDGVFMGGSLHWISSNKIIVLDLGTENYRQLKLPPLHERDRDKMLVRQQQLEVLGGRLILFDYGRDDWLIIHFDVWAVNDYGADESWTMLFTIEEYKIPDFDESLRPIAYMKNKMQVLLLGGWGSSLKLSIFDVESNSGKSVVIHGLTGELSAQAFHESIFRLHDNCGVSASVVPTERRRIRKKKMGSKMKISDATKLMFCVRDAEIWYHSHDSCFGIDSNWHCSSSEDED